MSHLSKKNFEILETRVKVFFENSVAASEFPTFKADEFYKDTEAKFEESCQLIPNERRKRLEKAPKKPERVQLIQVGFKRNQDVIVEVLERANGFCKLCKNFAPFLRDSNGTPYLEVHHRIPLAEGGDDTVENAIALCPNCHRKTHFGRKSL